MGELVGAVLFVSAVWAVIVGAFARRKNRNELLWGAIGGIAFVPAMVVLAFMPYLCPKCQGELTNRQWRDRTCPGCGDLRGVHSQPVSSDMVSPGHGACTCSYCGRVSSSERGIELEGRFLCERCFSLGIRPQVPPAEPESD